MKTCCHSNSSGILSANVDVKKSQRSKIMIIIIIPVKRPDLGMINQKKKTCNLPNFEFPAE